MNKLALSFLGVTLSTYARSNDFGNFKIKTYDTQLYELRQKSKL